MHVVGRLIIIVSDWRTESTLYNPITKTSTSYGGSFPRKYLFFYQRDSASCPTVRICKQCTQNDTEMLKWARKEIRPKYHRTFAIPLEKTGTRETCIQYKIYNWGYYCLLVPHNKEGKAPNIGCLNITSLCCCLEKKTVHDEIILRQWYTVKNL